MYTPASVDAAREFGIPVIVYLHNYEHFCPYLFKSYNPLTTPKEIRRKFWPWSVRVQQPFVHLLLQWHERALRKADLIIANSKSMAKILQHYYTLDAKILFPIIDIERYAVKKKGNAITFINPIKAKGVEVFIKIAKRIPQKQFLVVGGIFPEYLAEIKRLANVTYLPWTESMKTVYEKTRLLLVPSLWPEPFGRVPLEAAISGIPSIVSNRGGLPEAVGQGGIVIDDPKDIDAWVSAIASFDDSSFYKQKSTAAKKHALLYTKEKQRKRLEALVKQVLHEQKRQQVP